MKRARRYRNLSDIVNAADVGVCNLTGRADLAMKSREHGTVAGGRVWKELQCDQLTELQVLGFIYLAHSAATQQSDDAVSLCEYCARHESSLIEWCRFQTPRSDVVISVEPGQVHRFVTSTSWTNGRAVWNLAQTMSAFLHGRSNRQSGPTIDSSISRRQIHAFACDSLPAVGYHHIDEAPQTCPNTSARLEQN